MKEGSASGQASRKVRVRLGISGQIFVTRSRITKYSTNRIQCTEAYFNSSIDQIIEIGRIDTTNSVCESEERRRATSTSVLRLRTRAGCGPGRDGSRSPPRGGHGGLLQLPVRAGLRHRGSARLTIHEIATC